MEAVQGAFQPYIDHIDQIFKTITAYNGFEFVRLNELKKRGWRGVFHASIVVLWKGYERVLQQNVVPFYPRWQENGKLFAGRYRLFCGRHERFTAQDTWLQDTWWTVCSRMGLIHSTDEESWQLHAAANLFCSNYTFSPKICYCQLANKCWLYL